MIKPEYVITLKDGKRYITVKEASLMLQINITRVHEFVKLGKLSSTVIPRSNVKIIPLSEVKAFAKKPRPTGRPSKKPSKRH